MTWFRIDDGFWSHPKIVQLSDAAITLWTRSGSYSCQHLTDGHLTTHALRMVGGKARVADELVHAGLWETDNGGYRFHDWEHYQESSEVVLARRANARERQRKARAEREKKRHDAQMQSRDESRCDIPSDSDSDSRCEFSTPDPTRPDPTLKDSGTSRESSNGSNARGARLPPEWNPPDDVVRQMRDEHPHVDLRAEHAKFTDYWIAQPGAKGRKSDWTATWRNWIRRAAEHAPATNGNGHRPQQQQSKADIWTEAVIDPARAAAAASRKEIS